MTPPRPPSLSALSSDDLTVARAIRAGNEPSALFADRIGFACGTVVHLAVPGQIDALCNPERIGFVPHHSLTKIAAERHDRTLTLCRACAEQAGDPSLTSRFAAQRQIIAATKLAVPRNPNEARVTTATLRALRRRADLSDAVASVATRDELAGWCRVVRWAEQMLDYIGACCADLLAVADDTARPALLATAASAVVAYAAARPPYTDRLDMTALTRGSSERTAWTLLPGFLVDWTAATISGRARDLIAVSLDGGLTDVAQLANVPLLEPLPGEPVGAVAHRSWREHVTGQLRAYQAMLDAALADVHALDTTATVVIHVTRPTELANPQWAELLEAYPTAVGPRGRTEWPLPAVIAAQIAQQASLTHQIVRYLPTDEYTAVALKLWQPGTANAESLLCYAAQLARLVT